MARKSNTIKSSLSFSSRKFLVFGLVFAAIGGVVIYQTFALVQSEDLHSYYPNTSLYRTHYLEGFNYRDPAAQPSRAVLWFEDQGDGKFKLYNSAPEDKIRRCHWDMLQWTGGYLNYSQTRSDHCASEDNSIVYSPAIKYMPRYWGGSYWSSSGQSAATYTENGRVACQGINSWKAEVLGWVDLSPGVKAIHVRSNQSTYWTKGYSPTGCSAGYTSKYQDNHYLVKNLPLSTGGSAKGLKRTVGGSLDIYNQTKKWDWDIWFDKWQPLPST